MVHKKSEYSLQYHILAQDLRTQIWQENLKVRELFRSSNQADHYWTYQLSAEDPCDCESVAEEDDGLLPPHRRKHKALLAAYKLGKPERPAGLTWSSDLLDKPVNIPQPKECQPREEVGTQTRKEDWNEYDDSSQELRDLDKNLSLMSVSGGGEPFDDRDKVTSARPLTPLPIPSPTRPLTVHDVVQNFGTPLNPRRSVSASDHKSARRSLSRTSRRAYFEEKPSPFVAYGWNDVERVIGDKKTHNVQATPSEVHSHALNTFKRRQADIERYLEREAESRRSQTGVSIYSPPVNHSSIWRTEYQENFTPRQCQVTSARSNVSSHRLGSAPVARTFCRRK